MDKDLVSKNYKNYYKSVRENIKYNRKTGKRDEQAQNKIRYPMAKGKKKTNINKQNTKKNQNEQPLYKLQICFVNNNKRNISKS